MMRFWRMAIMAKYWSQVASLDTTVKAHWRNDKGLRSL
jgi:hypothetical protein